MVIGEILTPAGNARVVDTNLTIKDKIGAIRVRFGINRYNYIVETGLYAVGKPDKDSMVLVTANYKLTFDVLRKNLKGLDLWILVIDTKGINVWCAAGKGTFGNYEILKVINKVKLKEVIAHNTIILPQLGAPGTAAAVIAKAGFKVVYGPVRAEDIPEFLNNGMLKSEEMSQVNFNFIDRLVLTPMEYIPDLKYVVPFLPLLLVFNLLLFGYNNPLKIVEITLINYIPFLIAHFTGSVLVPLLLPYIPFNAFSLKGFTLSIILCILFVFNSSLFLIQDSIIVKAAYMLFIMFITSYSALQFTGSSTYTSFSGTTKETVYSIIAGGAACVIGIILLIVYIFIMR
ncbi:MAG: mercury methylation corrinoid protein HgcA [Solirubrobacterales bacterium]